MGGLDRGACEWRSFLARNSGAKALGRSNQEVTAAQPVGEGQGEEGGSGVRGADPSLPGAVVQR